MKTLLVALIMLLPAVGAGRQFNWLVAILFAQPLYA